MLMQAGIRNVTLRSCYCCSEYGNVVFVVEGENQETILDAFRRINVPIASILEAEEIKQTVAEHIMA
jgi:nitrate reductase NapAB chaperone NapD